MKVKGQILICTAIMLNDHSNPYIESTTVLSDRDCYGRFALFWPMGKLKFELSLSVSTQFDFYQHQGGTHVESY